MRTFKNQMQAFAIKQKICSARCFSAQALQIFLLVVYSTLFSAAAAVVHAQQTHHIQEDVDEVQIQGQCTVDGSLFGQFAVVGVVRVHLAQLLGIIGGQQHEHHQTDAAVQHRCAEAHAEQHAHKAGDDQCKQRHHQLGAPAGQVFVGSGAVDGHQAEIQRGR